MSPLFLNLYLIICVNFGHAVKGINIWLLYNSVHVCAYVRLLYGLNLLKIQLNIMRFLKKSVYSVWCYWDLEIQSHRQGDTVWKCLQKWRYCKLRWLNAVLHSEYILLEFWSCSYRDIVLLLSDLFLCSVYNVQMFLSAWPWSVTLL